MATQDSDVETEIRERVDDLVAAIRAMDIDALRQIYAPDIVTFDVGGPLQRVGIAGKLRNWEEAFAMFQAPLGYELRDLSIETGGDIAIAHGFGRLSGTLRNGQPGGGFWVRFTACLRRTRGTWLVAHDHASVPLDMASGRASMNLEP